MRLILTAVLAIVLTPLAKAAEDWTFRSALVDGIVAPAYADLADAATELETAWSSFCGGGGTDDAVIAAFHRANDAFMTVQWVSGVGAGTLFQRNFRIFFWPDDRNVASRHLAGVLQDRPADLLDPETLAAQSVAVQGLPAMERLLFGEAAPVPGSYECGLAMSIAGNVRTIVDATWNDWGNADAMPGTAPDRLAATVFDAVYGHLELVADRKLGRVIGATPADARHRRSEAWRSGRSLRNISINLVAVRAVLETLATLVDSDGGREAMAVVLADIGAAERSIDRHAGKTLQEVSASEDGHRDLTAAVEYLYGARERLATQVAPALGLSIGFNSLDGD